MEPQIRYARTSDGVSIAYWKLGLGPVLVVTPPIPYGHIEMEWQIEEIRTWYELLAQTRTLIRYDRRGSGLSDRDIEDYSVAAQARDILAVADAIQAERIDLFAQDRLGPAAIAFAAEFPERLSHLLLWCTWARARGMRRPQIVSLSKLLRVDWPLFTETLVDWETDRHEAARRYADVMRESVSAEGFLQSERAATEVDVADLLPLVQAPTLVVHRRHLKWPPMEQSRLLASSIPHASLVVLEGRGAGVFVKGWEEVLEQVDLFLSAEEGKLPPATPVAQGTAIILFADIASSTALTERLGDAAFRDRSRAIDAAVREAVRAAGGTPVEGKVMGDGVMSTFASARQAIDAALRCREAAAQHELPLHLGIHAGDVIRERDNVYGGAVNIAARICDASSPGEILVSEIVRGLARTSAGVTFEDRGERTLKGIDDPVRVFAVLRRSNV
jgi:class 3 adenylate cyclase/pimeloyl-ACP methyl ester carboxylesterase